MPGKIICFGDLCVDVVGRTDNAETRSDVTLADLSIRAAGAAVNCAIRAAAEGVAVEMIGLVGDDIFAELLLRDLTAAHVGTEHIRRISGRTGGVISIVDSGGQTKLYSYRGVNALAYGLLPPLSLSADDLIYVSGYSFQDHGSRLTAENLLSSGVRCALDPSFQYARDFHGKSISLEFFLPNLEEARLMTGLSSPEDCSALLRQSGAKTVVVKLGSDGCYINSDEVAEFVKSEPVRAIDTTGAGDAFAGTFLASILKGHGIVEAANQANRIARELVSRKGR